MRLSPFDRDDLAFVWSRTCGTVAPVMPRALILPPILCSLAGLCPIPSAAAPPHPVATPEAFVLHPDLELRLFAREPAVVDPVGLCFDALGRAYVLEMRDYPFGFGPDRKPGGTIRLLEDTDGDGTADKATLFAEGLSFPTSILPWANGVLVTAPPEILYLEDRNADGRADHREVVLTGFKLGVTDSNFSGLRWGLDNWVHAVNGGNGGSVRSPRKADAPPLQLGDRDFRFRPDTGDIELTSDTGGGFGLVFDDWGRSFTPHNINHIQQRIADNDVLDRFRGLPAISTTHSISDHGEMARIFGVAVAQVRPNHPEQAGHFSAAGAMGYIAHRGWPARLHGSALVCDVAANLVHRDLLVPDGPILRATRAPEEQTSEFFASRDPEFRPTGVETGPDGALYLLDMQRAVIEHPDYIPRKLLDTLDIRAGDDRGRVYRITPRDPAAVLKSLRDAGTEDPSSPGRELLPAKATPRQRVTLLGSPNPWTRQTAQRLLVAARETNVVKDLRKLLKDTRPHPSTAVARVHALWTLEGLGALDPASIEEALRDPEPGVRVNALHVVHPMAARFERQILALLEDPDPWVRMEAAFAAGALPESPSHHLARLLQKDRAWEWSRRAVLSALPASAATAILPEVIPTALKSAGDPRDQALARELAARATAADAATASRALDALLTAMNASPPGTPSVLAATLDGALDGLNRAPERPSPNPGTRQGLARLASPTSGPQVFASAWRLARALGIPDTPEQAAALAQALRDARDATLDAEARIRAIHLTGFGSIDATLPTLLALLSGTEPSTLQRAAFDILREHREPAVGSGLTRAWPAVAPSLRPGIVNLLVYRQAFQPALLDALEAGHLQVGELNLDLEHRRALLRHAPQPIRERAARFVDDGEYANRRNLVDEWLPRLPAAGDPAAGRVHFERLCAQCHRSGDLGFNVGPDLTDQRHRSVEDLLSNILDPNMAMNPTYAAYGAELKDGESETGILAAENTASITLLQAGGRRVELPRSRIASLRSSGRSLMPEGLETGLTPADLRDLIAFLQQPASHP